MTNSEYQKKWREEHREEIKEYQRNWRKKNNEHIKAKAAEYRKNNPGKIKGWQRKHRIKKRGRKKIAEEQTEIICSFCGKKKPVSECKKYKTHKWKICDTCYRDYYKPFSKKYYRQKLKTDPNWVEKNRAKAKAYHHNNREKVLKKAKLYRQTAAYKKLMRDYRKKNKKKIHAQEVITKRRYHEKNRDALTDKYIRSLLRTNGNPSPTAEQIERKRAEILILRICL